MSDTSGSGGFGSSVKRIRMELKMEFSPPPQRKAVGGDGHEPEKVTGKTLGPILQTIIWKRLAEDDHLKSVLLPLELIYYIKEMARFIDISKKPGLPAVVVAFGVRDTSMFHSLRRVILRYAPGNSLSSEKSGSEHHSRAGGAFISGSAFWAQDVSGSGDLTQITIKMLVDKIQSKDKYGCALKSSARHILKEYGERVIRALTREDDPWADAADEKLIKDFSAQLNQFFAQHDQLDEWTSDHVQTTLEKFQSFVLTS